MLLQATGSQIYYCPCKSIVEGVLESVLVPQTIQYDTMH